MDDRQAVRRNWIFSAILLASLGLATVPGAVVAGDAKSNDAAAQSNDSAKSAPAQTALPAPEPFQEEDLSDPEEKKAADEAFNHFQATVDVINENVGKQYGGPPFPKLEYTKPRVVKVIPNQAWMKDQRIHYRNAMMLYRMWRTANQFHPVMIMIADDKGGDYITIKDTPKGLEYRARQY